MLIRNRKYHFGFFYEGDRNKRLQNMFLDKDNVNARITTKIKLFKGNRYEDKSYNT